MDRINRRRIIDLCAIIAHEGLNDDPKMDDRLHELTQLLGSAQWDAVRKWKATCADKDIEMIALQRSFSLMRDRLAIAQQPLRDATVRVVALNSGFSLKQQPDDRMDLNPYVYEFARRIRAI